MSTVCYIPAFNELIDAYECMQDYRYPIYKAVNDIHDLMNQHREFVRMFSGEESDREKMFKVFMDLLNKTIKETLCEEKDFPLYKIMRDDYIFFTRWSKEFFDHFCMEYSRIDWIG